MKQLSTLLLALLTAVAGFAQRDPRPLPRYLTDFEVKQWGIADDLPVSSNIITQPPVQPVRAMAEWEELQAVLISWVTNTTNDNRPLLAEIVRAAREECKVIVCCRTQSIVSSAKTYLTDRGIDLNTNVEFLVVPNDSIWIRDYGPNCVYANDVDSLYFVDWIYNRNRKRDDTLATTISRYLNIPLYGTLKAPYDLVNTGGNVMSDGMGNAFSSKLVLDENGEDNTYGQSSHSESAVDGIMKDFMGIRRYTKMETLPYDGIHHIDMHMKLLDEQTLLVGQYPAGRSDGPQIEANLQYVLSQMSAFGSPYRVVRIPMPPYFSNQHPPFANNPYLYPTYANSVFINKTILMPKYNQALDQEAKAIYERALPGYKVVPIDCQAIIGDGGAIHCITKELGVLDPLRIVHQPLESVQQSAGATAGYPVKALIQHRSGIASARVWFTSDSSASVWQSTVLNPSLQPDSLDYWQGLIPYINAGGPAAKPVYYYIEAQAISGKKQVRPMPAPKGWWKFNILPETVGTQAAASAKLLDIYPNPATAITCIPVSVSRRTKGDLRIFNALGQEMHTIFNGYFPSGSSNHFIDASQYAPGVYFVALQAEGKTVLRKIMVR